MSTIHRPWPGPIAGFCLVSAPPLACSATPSSTPSRDAGAPHPQDSGSSGSGWVTAPGVPNGTYVTQAGPYDQLSCAAGQTNCGSGGVGTYQLSVPGGVALSVAAGTTLTGQRYDNYKMPINVGTDDAYFINDIGFTSE